MRILLLAALLVIGIVASAQPEASASAEELRNARETMDRVESDVKKYGRDQRGIALILGHEMAQRAAYTYLVLLPGYDEARTNGRILEFKEQAKKDHKDFKKLYKAEKKAREEKEEYLSAISSEYSTALEVYRQVE